MTHHFYGLGIAPKILGILEHIKFKVPTPIQEKAIPLALEGKDILASSATGSGKTLAFGAGIIEKIKKGMGIQALILTPTRELAEQVADSIRKFSKNKEIVICSVEVPKDLFNKEITPGLVLLK